MNRKTAILHAGMDLLKVKGLAALTQPQVAKAAGLTQSHLTYYFPTRDALLLSIAEFSVDTILSELNERLTVKPARQTLASEVIRNILDGLPPRVILGLIVASDSDPAIREALQRLISHVRDRIRMLLKKSGLACDYEAALLFHATIVGLAVMHQARQSPISGREIELGIRAIIGKLAHSVESHAGD